MKGSIIRRNVLTCIFLVSFPQITLPRQTPSLITLDAPGWSIKMICAAISTQIGQKVEPHGSCVDDHLIVKVHNVPWPVFMKKLAWAEYGEWYKDGSTLILERDCNQVTAEIQKNIQEVAKRLDVQFKRDSAADATPFNADNLVKKIKYRAQELARKDTDTVSVAAKYQNGVLNALLEFCEQMPLGRFLRKVVEAFPVEVFAQIPPDVRVVFSNRPTSLEYPFPSSAEKQLSRLIANTRKFQRAAHALGIPLSNTLGATLAVKQVGELGPVETVLISIRSTSGIGFDAKVREFDSNGNLIATSAEAFYGANALPSKNQSKSKDQFVKLGKNVVRNYRSLELFHPEPPTANFKKVLRHPSKVDPLEVILGPIINATVPAKDIIVRNDFIGLWVPDIITDEDKGVIPRKILTDGNLAATADINRSNRWIVIRPSIPSNSSEQAVSRFEFQNLIHSVTSDGLVDFMSAMKFVHSVGSSGIEGMGTTANYLSALTYGTNPLAVSGLDWLIFDLVGSLDAGQFAQTNSEHGLNLAELRPQQMRIFKRILLYHFLPGYSNLNQGEPTVAFANLIPKAILRVSSKTEQMISYHDTQGGFTFNETSDPNQFAAQLPYFKNEVISDLRLEPERTVTITISFPDSKKHPYTSEFVTRSHSTHIYASWKDFPHEVTEAIATRLQKQGK